MKDNKDIVMLFENETKVESTPQTLIPYLIKTIQEMKVGQGKDAQKVAIKDKKLLSIEEAADLFGIGMGKIRELTDSDNCPFVIWIGSHRKIKRDAFEEYIMRQYSV